MRKLAGWCVLICALAWANANAAILQVTGGILTGATGVIVSGQSYDVSFQDGSCFGLFSECNSNSDFAFSPVLVGSASQALLDQVFIDGVDGAFDSDPHLTNGCNVLNPGVCGVLTPSFITVAGDVVVNIARNAEPGNIFLVDGVESRIVPIIFDSSGVFDEVGPVSVWAVWSASAAASVPEPSTYAILLASLGLLGFTIRRGKHKAA